MNCPIRPWSLSSRRAWIEISPSPPDTLIRRSLSSRRAWIEMPYMIRRKSDNTGRSPHGERGLKSFFRWSSYRCQGRSPHGERGLKSTCCGSPVMKNGRSPHGERGLKFDQIAAWRSSVGRSPHGERGLKFKNIKPIFEKHGSLSSRRAWIEIKRKG